MGIAVGWMVLDIHSLLVIGKLVAHRLVEGLVKKVHMYL